MKRFLVQFTPKLKPTSYLVDAADRRDAYNRVSIALERGNTSFDEKAFEWNVVEVSDIPEAPTVTWGPE
jgi:hypothetical protein